jgi:hypothetical protein
VWVTSGRREREGKKERKEEKKEKAGRTLPVV